jgi:ribosomal protein S12 methylthiotransferase accessory factor
MLISFAELCGLGEVVDVSRLPRLSVSTFDTHERILWIAGFDLIGQVVKWVPYECVHTDYRLPLPPGSGCFAVNSNGLASGNHLLEAVSHGLTEVIERDASALFHAGRRDARKSRRVDPAGIAHADAARLVERFADAGVLIGLWRMTSDIGVPAYRCEIVDDEAHQHRGLGPSLGAGCHLSVEIALCRAIAEAAQGRLTRIASSRDDVPRLDYDITRNEDVLASVRADLAGSDLPSFPAEGAHPVPLGFAEEVDQLIDELVGIGVVEVIVVDLSLNGIDVPVVRVIVPGLEAPHEAPGYVPGPRARMVAGAA